MRAFYWSIAKLKMKRKKNKNTTGGKENRQEEKGGVGKARQPS